MANELVSTHIVGPFMLTERGNAYIVTFTYLLLNEKNYHTTEIEALPVVRATKKWRLTTPPRIRKSRMLLVPHVVMEARVFP